jgi:twinkle protein
LIGTSSKLPCPSPDCNSSDAFGIDDRGWGHCFSCGINIPPSKLSDNILNKPIRMIHAETSFSPLTEVFRPFPERGFTEETVKRYKVQVGREGDGFLAKYPVFSVSTGEHIGNKVRLPDKHFLFEGSVSDAGLFGRHAFSPGSSRFVTVTEGQDDALAAYQLTGSKYACVSIHGAATAERDVRRDFEYLNSFENIVFAFDTDEPGRKAAKAAASVGFPLGKVKVLNLRKFKDANDYLLNKSAEDFSREWWQAPTFKPDGLKLGSDMWKEIIDRKESFTVPYPISGLNKLTFGLRLSEMVIVTADSGVGKTSVLKTIEHLLLTHPDVKEKNYGVGFLHLEEPNGDTALGLLSIHNRIPYHLPTSDRPEADLRKAYDELLNNDRVVIWDHFGSNSVDAVLDKVRHMAALGCKYIVLDHLSIIVSDQSGDERKQLDEIATKLKTLTMELDLAVIAVIHTNRQGQIRGTAGVEQLANIVIRLQRDKTDVSEWRRNITKLTVEKNRFSGYTGPAAYLWYNKDTGCLSELDDEDIAIFEQGGQISDDRQGF